jgi:predicted NAD/FAD-binding protein
MRDYKSDMFTYIKKKTLMKIGILGSGIGGLATAARLVVLKMYTKIITSNEYFG